MSNVTIRVLNGSGWRDQDLIGKSDPFCKVTVGNQVQQTREHKSAGTQAVWNHTMTFSGVDPRSPIYIEVLDRDTGRSDRLGSGQASLASAAPGQPTPMSVPLQPSGQVQIEVTVDGGYPGGYQSGYGYGQSGYGANQYSGYRHGSTNGIQDCRSCGLPIVSDNPWRAPCPMGGNHFDGPVNRQTYSQGYGASPQMSQYAQNYQMNLEQRNPPLSTTLGARSLYVRNGSNRSPSPTGYSQQGYGSYYGGPASPGYGGYNSGYGSGYGPASFAPSATAGYGSAYSGGSSYYRPPSPTGVYSGYPQEGARCRICQGPLDSGLQICSNCVGRQRAMSW